MSCKAQSYNKLNYTQHEILLIWYLSHDDKPRYNIQNV